MKLDARKILSTAGALALAIIACGCAATDAVVNKEIASLRQEISENNRKLNDALIMMETLNARLLIIEKDNTGAGTKAGVKIEGKKDVEGDIKKLPTVKLTPKTYENGGKVIELSDNEQEPPKDKKAKSQPKLIKIDNSQHAAAGGEGKEKKEDEEREFKAALSFYQQKKYNDAVKGFSNFLKAYPEGKRAPDAAYYSGLCYLAEGEYELAIDELKKTLEYQNTDRAPEAMLSIGIAYLKLGKKSEGEKALKFVMENYPDTQAANLAKEAMNL